MPGVQAVNAGRCENWRSRRVFGVKRDQCQSLFVAVSEVKLKIRNHVEQFVETAWCKHCRSVRKLVAVKLVTGEAG